MLARKFMLSRKHFKWVGSGTGNDAAFRLFI